jgi:hypothetical protein
MPFDDILKRSIDALTRDLASAVQAERDEASRRAKDVAEESAAAAIADAQAVAELRGMTAGREEGFAEGRRQGFNQGRQEGYEAGKSDGYRIGKGEGFLAGKGAGATAHAADEATAQRLADAMRAIDGSRSLSEILDTLAGCAGRETTRAAVFLVRDGQLRGWRFIGFGPDFDRASAFEAPLKDGGVLEEAIRTEGMISTDSSAPGSAPRFAEVGPDCEMFAASILVGGRVVAALYADQHAAGKEGRDPRFAWRPGLEMMARHAGRCLEGITAIRAAQLRTGAQPRSDERAGLAGPPASDEDSAARRYAKLLVSEIKLYHEAEVVAGRRERDLGTRLGGEIARSRLLYEQRVPPQARAGVDYFQQELVQALAEGDESLLKSEV